MSRQTTPPRWSRRAQDHGSNSSQAIVRFTTDGLEEVTYEHDAADRSVDYSRLRSDLARLGPRPGGIVMVHASLSAVGWIPGGADAVVRALREVLSADGTIMMLSSWEHHSYDLERWPRGQRTAYLADPPVFDPQVSTSDPGLGRLVERVRTWPGAHRSRHPLGSFTALGPHSEQLLSDQPWDGMYGLGSPLDRLVKADGQVLMLGAPLDTATILHYAEAMAVVPDPPAGPGKQRVTYRMPLNADAPHADSSRVVWRTFTELETGSDYDPAASVLPYSAVVGTEVDPFEVIMTEALDAGLATSGMVGNAPSHLFPARDLSDFGTRWIEARFGVDRQYVPSSPTHGPSTA